MGAPADQPETPIDARVEQDANPPAPVPLTGPPASRRPVWREKLERNALWVSLGAIALAAAVVAVGVQVAPETWYDRFWWEDIYGPLVVDARQCRNSSDAHCQGIGPADVSAKDGYTITSELTYGLVLATLLYGIYVGLFRRFQIIADGWFVAGLMPWILLGPTARVLEDTNVFCRFGSITASSQCEPGVFAYVFISPVIYLHIAVYVIAALLLGVYIRSHAHDPPRRLTAIIGAVLLAGVIAYAYVGTQMPREFSALPPLWAIALVALLAGALFHWRARQGLATVNLTTFVLGLPFAAGCLWLIGEWLAGDRWAHPRWGGYEYLGGAFILVMAALTAAVVFALSKWLGRSGVGAKWAQLAMRVPEKRVLTIGKLGGIALALGLLLSGILPAFNALVQDVPSREMLIPLLSLGGALVLLVFGLLYAGHDEAKHPGAVLLFTVGINVALIFAHAMDGLATWVAISDPLGLGLAYGEKHPFSEFLLKYWDGFLFPFVKVMMVFVVAWMLDRETRNAPADASFDSRNMVGLVKMAIFVLGFAPGLRDVLRLTMGV